MELVEGCLSAETKERISQFIAIVRDSSNLLLKKGRYREASHVLTLTGGACRRLGERHCGLEHQEYILQVWECDSWEMTLLLYELGDISM